MVDAEKLSQARFGSYILREKIGEGGFSVVYKGEHSSGGREVAIKVMREEVAADKSKVKDFHREYGILEEFDHPNIPEVYDIGDVRELPAYSMKLCPGETFYSLRMQNIRFDIVGAWLAMIRTLCAVHEAGVVHNDLKLENMLLSGNGQVSLLDFGSARRTGGTGWFSKVVKSKRKHLTGTITYLAPELLEGKEANKQSDVYSLGMAAHVLFFGSAPMKVGSGVEGARALYKILKTTGIKKVESRGPVPTDLANIIDSCCRVDPAGRPGDAIDLWQRVNVYFKRPSAVKVSELSRKLLPKAKKTELFKSKIGDS
jgi:serine/threonine-protein kinase